MDEIGFENTAFALPGYIAGRDVIVAAQVRQQAGESVDIAGAVEIYPKRKVFRDGQIVNRGEVVERGREGTNDVEVLGVDTKVRPGNITLDN